MGYTISQTHTNGAWGSPNTRASHYRAKKDAIKSLKNDTNAYCSLLHYSEVLFKRAQIHTRKRVHPDVGDDLNTALLTLYAHTHLLTRSQLLDNPD